MVIILLAMPRKDASMPSRLAKTGSRKGNAKDPRRGVAYSCGRSQWSLRRGHDISDGISD